MSINHLIIVHTNCDYAYKDLTHRKGIHRLKLVIIRIWQKHIIESKAKNKTSAKRLNEKDRDSDRKYTYEQQQRRSKNAPQRIQQTKPIRHATRNYHTENANESNTENERRRLNKSARMKEVWSYRHQNLYQEHVQLLFDILAASKQSGKASENQEIKHTHTIYIYICYKRVLAPLYPSRYDPEMYVSSLTSRKSVDEWIGN